MTDTIERTVKKNLRVRPAEWERIERAAEGTALSANQLVMALAMEALDRRERPRGVAELRIARASLFAAQALARDLIAAGRETEVEEIRAFISTIVPDPDAGNGPGRGETG
ncbi:MAG: hypothetical protein OXE86_10535 [Alphaproteobacteria bacterium]|nr:hypothetical protein [Alphaproteobacteria bacterium]